MSNSPTDDNKSQEDTHININKIKNESDAAPPDPDGDLHNIKDEPMNTSGQKEPSNEAQDESIKLSEKDNNNDEENEEKIKIEEINTQNKETISEIKNDNDEDNEPITLSLGGTCDKPSYALLTGLYEDIKKSTKTTVKIPITALPAILGRTQKTTNEHIFDLGNCKALSRKHALIFYSDIYGGKLGKYTKDNDLHDDYHTDNGESQNEYKTIDDNWNYKKPKQSKKVEINVIRPKGIDLPQDGFFAIQCISKNKLLVGKQRVGQGEIALLTNGTTIRMASYNLYFLLPEEDALEKAKSIPHPMQRQLDSDDDVDGPPNKKLKRDFTPAGKNDPYEGKPLSELLEEFVEAVANDVFERKHSIMSGYIMYHAVQDVARDPNLQKKSKTGRGVSRSEIMDWIENHKVYKSWVKALLTKLETKSYQANLSKALIKAGFTRIGTTGRHVKWTLPAVPTKSRTKRVEQADKDAAKAAGNGGKKKNEIEKEAEGGDNASQNGESAHDADDEENIDEQEKGEDVEMEGQIEVANEKEEQKQDESESGSHIDVDNEGISNEKNKCKNVSSSDDDIEHDNESSSHVHDVKDDDGDDDGNNNENDNENDNDSDNGSDSDNGNDSDNDNDNSMEESCVNAD